MNEVKKPNKPLFFYYGIALLVIVLFNLLLMPRIAEKQVKEVDYGTFIKMTEQKELDEVDIASNKIVFPTSRATFIKPVISARTMNLFPVSKRRAQSFRRR